MSQTVRQPVFSSGIILGMGTLLALTIGLAAAARLTNHNHVILPPSQAIAARDLSFADLADGGVAITDAATGRLISTVAPQTGGFIRGIMRGLVRQHRLEDKPPHSSFRLTRWSDGRLSIEDPATHESFELEAFGSTNENVFARLLQAPGAS